MPATSENVNDDRPWIRFVKTPRIPRPISATEAAAPATRTSAGAPVDISAAMAWAAKYVEPNGFRVRQPPGSETVQDDSSRLTIRSPAHAASGVRAQRYARNPQGLRTRRRC